MLSHGVIESGQKKGRHRARRLLTLGGTSLALVALGMFNVGSASAVALSMDGNATVPSGYNRLIAAAWGTSGPFKVNFVCNVPGCANFVTSSTQSVTLSRYIQVITCVGAAYTSTITVWENAGAGASASTNSTTRWLKGACKVSG
jgi:hypothetical protein